MDEQDKPTGQPGDRCTQDQIGHMHDECVPAAFSHRTHLHEGQAGSWLFPSEAVAAG